MNNKIKLIGGYALFDVKNELLFDEHVQDVDGKKYLSVKCVN